MLENLFLQGARTLHQGSQIADGIEPLVEQSFQFGFRLRKLRHFQIDEGQLVVEHLFGVRLHELHFVIVRRGARGETKIQDTDRVDGLQTIIPIATGCLLAHGERRIVNAAVLEELLLAFLHFHQKILAPLVRAVDIEHGTAVIFLRAQMFRIEIGDVLDLLASLQEGVEETDKQVLVDFCPKKFLEREIRIEIDITVVNAF